MNEHDDSLIRSKISVSAENLEVKQPSTEQDRIFQRNLDKFCDDTRNPVGKNLSRWLVAATVVLSVGLVSVFIGSPINESVTGKQELSELIASSNQLEKQLAMYDEYSLDAKQFAAYIRLRLEIEQIDQQLNQYYLSNNANFKSEVNLLWKQRVKAVKNLKSIYESETLVARI